MPMVWVIVAVVVVLLVVLFVALSMRRRRSHELQRGFGPEYDRTVDEQGRRSAERDLIERRKRREAFEIRELEPGARERYAQRWAAAQQEFVDNPISAVGTADVLVREVMHDRGYPVEEDFEQRAADISVDHPVLVENYRAAHSISVRAQSRDATTEQLRQSMVHYRALFDDLLAPSQPGATTSPEHPESTDTSGRQGAAPSEVSQAPSEVPHETTGSA